ncbi:substrate-binding domain-containing protein [Cytophagales bacterium LB-30]|uniref:Substrate-binding domain-containing protein n=1 Tax=Shiella aurantiaca TaxID=3058365 RepID=A0ABT8F406_9BACT|nr:substrate-binding domain-containing protein [Shiella aurantiaca]MDN4165181.1 substrate-binding domain-containing protein [Shiella aurantiaca]
MSKRRFLMAFCMGLLAFSTQVHAQKVGFLLDSYIMDRWYLDHKFFEEKVKSMGGECRVEVPNGDAVLQVSMAKKMIDEGVEVLVVVPIDADMAGEIVSYAKKKNVPVISYDRLIKSQDIAAYIGYNSEMVGRMEAEYLVKKVPEGNYVLINGPTSDNNAILQRKGQKEVLAPYIQSGKIKLVGDLILRDWSEIETLMRFDEFISTTDERIDAIIAGNDVVANGCIQALPKDQVGKIAVAGQDADISAIKNIIAGSQTVTIYKPIKPLAELAAQTAMELKKGNSSSDFTEFTTDGYTVKALLLNPIQVYKENINDTVLKDGHVTSSQLSKKN